MRTPLLIGILSTLAGSCLAADLATHELWTGVNGKTFRATFDQVLPDGQRAQFFTAKGERLIVEIAKLVPRDKELILNRENEGAKPVPAAGDPTAFKPEATLDRKLIPQFDPKKFGASNWEAMVDALWVSLLWWEQANVLEIPKKGDFDRKAEWLHKELTRRIAATGSSAATLEDAQKGMDKYFQENLKDVAGCRIYLEKKDFTPARLGRLCQGANAVILKMTMTYANGRGFSVCTVLESITEDGKFVLHVFGKRFTGSIQPVKDSKHAKEFVLDNRGDLPARYAESEAHFEMGFDGWNGVLVLRPYIYAQPGKPSPLPPDAELAPAKTVE
jgi:hypothetical protein